MKTTENQLPTSCPPKITKAETVKGGRCDVLALLALNHVDDHDIAEAAKGDSRNPKASIPARKPARNDRIISERERHERGTGVDDYSKLDRKPRSSARGEPAKESAQLNFRFLPPLSRLPVG